MKEQLIEFQTAKLAKEKEFIADDVLYYYEEDGTSGFHYNDAGTEIDTSFKEDIKDYFTKDPTYLKSSQSLLQKWLRDTHDVEVYVVPHPIADKEGVFYEVVVDKIVTTWSGYDTYEKALEKGLYEALKLIKTE